MIYGIRYYWVRSPINDLPKRFLRTKTFALKSNFNQKKKKKKNQYQKTPKNQYQKKINIKKYQYQKKVKIKKNQDQIKFRTNKIQDY